MPPRIRISTGIGLLAKAQAADMAVRAGMSINFHAYEDALFSCNASRAYLMWGTRGISFQMKDGYWVPYYLMEGKPILQDV